MMYARCIAIDGPSASGKSSVGFQVAQQLGYLFLDTGILFRAVCWALLREGSPFTSPRFTAAAQTLAVRLTPPTASEVADGRTTTVQMAGRDVTWDLRRPEVDQLLPSVAADPDVRAALTVRMRTLGLRHLEDTAPDGGVVVVGRDIGTVVFPDAGHKFFLDAAPETRARRRYRELTAQGKALPLVAVRNDMRKRDRRDATRAVAPSIPAANADIIDTTNLTLEETVAEVMLRVMRSGRVP